MSTSEGPPVDGLDISPEFIEEQRALATGQNSPKKRGGPYTRAQRRKRRLEVWRLHFEKGMPAIRIADAMKVDRHTIDEDLKLLYREAARQWHGDNSINDLLFKQLVRLESQRDRLMSYFEKAQSDVELILSIERQITDIDYKLLTIMERLTFNNAAHWDGVVKELNRSAERNNLDIRFTSIFEVMKISQESRKTLKKIRQEAGV